MCYLRSRPPFPPLLSLSLSLLVEPLHQIVALCPFGIHFNYRWVLIYIAFRLFSSHCVHSHRHSVWMVRNETFQCKLPDLNDFLKSSRHIIFNSYFIWHIFYVSRSFASYFFLQALALVAFIHRPILCHIFPNVKYHFRTMHTALYRTH